MAKQMMKIYFNLKLKFLFFEDISVIDSKGSVYSTWYEGCDLYLKRNNRCVFTGDVYEKTYLNEKEVSCSNRHAPKSFVFDDGNTMSFTGYSKVEGVRSSAITLNGNDCAQVSCLITWGGLQEKYVIDVNSDDQNIIDMVLFAFMHEYNWEHIYVGT